MTKISQQNMINDAKIGGFVGIGISLTLTIATGGLSHWLGSIIFGFIVGVLITAGNEGIFNLFSKAFPNYNRPFFPLLAVVYTVSAAIFYFFSLFFNIFFMAIPQRAELLLVSLGVGIASVMIALFFIYKEEKEETLRLEKENRKLAVVDERNRIARELHDSVSQNLFGISLNLNTLDIILKNESIQARELTKLIKGMVEEAQAEMRLMIYELKPAVLIEKGFFEALEGLISLFRARYKLDIQSALNGLEILDSRKQLILYRIVQESLNNIVKHAGATKAKVYLKLQNCTGELIIQDNGQGFTVTETNESEHLGIKGMKERVAEMGGQFAIESGMGKGTTVKVRF